MKCKKVFTFQDLTLGFLAINYAGLQLDVIADAFTKVTYSAISQAGRQISLLRDQNKKLRAEIDDILTNYLHFKI